MSKLKKINDLLDKFDEPTHGSLDLFLKSPFFNKSVSKREEMVELYKYFRRINNNTRANLTERVVYRRIYPKRSYSNIMLDRLLTRFINLLEEFTVHYQLKQNPAKQELELMNCYGEYALYDYFTILQGRLKTTYTEKKTKTPEDYHRLFKLSFDEYKYYGVTNAHNIKQEKMQIALNETLQFLDIYYLLNKLRMVSHFLNQQKIINKNFTVVLMAEILDQIENSKLLNIPLINAYYHSLMFLKDKSNETNYNILQKLLDEDTFEDNEEDEKFLTDFALNYCAIKINAGENEYYIKLLQSYKSALKRKSFYVDGYLFIDTTKNIVTVALRLGELIWAEEFLNNYKDKFHPDAKDYIYNYSMARLKFSKKDFDLALASLNKATENLSFLNDQKYNVPFFTISVKVFSIKIYYEQYEIDDLDRSIRALSRFIKLNTIISKPFKKSYKNFVKRLRGLISIAHFEKDKLKKLLIKIEETEYLAERQWLKEKAEEKLQR